jgi:hypothetical protein
MFPLLMTSLGKQVLPWIRIHILVFCPMSLHSLCRKASFCKPTEVGREWDEWAESHMQCICLKVKNKQEQTLAKWSEEELVT